MVRNISAQKIFDDNVRQTSETGSVKRKGSEETKGHTEKAQSCAQGAPGLTESVELLSLPQFSHRRLQALQLVVV